MKPNTKKIILGTAQFQSNYGITNFQKFSQQKKIKLLEYAWDTGIRNFDTAPYYGNSEKILGDFIKVNGLQKEIKVFTKISKNISKKNLFETRILKSIEKSFKNLNIQSLECLYAAENISIKNLDYNCLKKVEKNFPIKNIGASIYDKSEINYSNSRRFSIFQVPLNIANQISYNKIAAKNKLIARSIFLQGLLLSQKTNKILDPDLKKSLKRYFKYLKKNNLDRISIAISYIEQVTNISKYIIGVTDKRQLKMIMNINLIKLKKNIYSHIYKYFSKKKLDPRKW